MKRTTKVLLGLGAIGIFLFGVTGSVLAFTSPEKLDAMLAIADKGLEGLKAYFEFLLELLKETVA